MSATNAMEKIDTIKTLRDEIGRLQLEAKQACESWAADCREKEKAEAERDALRALLKELRIWLGDEQWGRWSYMEGTGVHEDLAKWSASIDAALGGEGKDERR